MDHKFQNLEVCAAFIIRTLNGKIDRTLTGKIEAWES